MRRGTIKVNYYQVGRGAPLVYLHGAGGLPAITPDLAALAEHFTVTAPLHPGFGTTGDERLGEDVLRLVMHSWDVVDALGIDEPILVGHSFGGMVAAEMAALEPRRVKRLVLVAPAGLYLEECPTADFFAMTPDELAAAAFDDPKSKLARSFVELPSDPHEAAEVGLRRLKGLAAAARFLWPLGDRGLSDRLYRVKAPTLLLWGKNDKMIPPAYAAVFARLLENAAEVRTATIPRAGHMVLLEQTAQATHAIISFCSR
jgi:pimeloyl-ACP methyl ester carboxylesterase